MFSYMYVTFQAAIAEAATESGETSYQSEKGGKNRETER